MQKRRWIMSSQNEHYLSENQQKKGTIMNKKVLATTIILTGTIFNSSNGYAGTNCSPIPTAPANCRGGTLLTNLHECNFACACYDGNITNVVGIPNYDINCKKDSTGKKYLPLTYADGVLSCPKVSEAKENEKEPRLN
jgi:hypothetical protein